MPDGVGSVRLLDPDAGTLESVAAPSLDREYVDSDGRAHHGRRHRGVPERDRTARGARPRDRRFPTRGHRAVPRPTGCAACGRSRSAAPTARSSSASSGSSCAPCAIRNPASWRCSNASATSPRSRSTATRGTKELGHLALHDTAHRPAQPGAGAGPTRARARAARQRRRRGVGRGAVRRPRPLQARERRPRPRDRRRAARSR